MSANAEASRAELYIVAESTHGTTPASPAFRRVRHKATTIAGVPDTIVTDELANHAQVTDTVRGIHNAGGDVEFELSKSNFDSLILAAIRGDSYAAITSYVADSLSFAAADNSINDSELAFPTMRPGDTITISGSASNNGTAVVVSITAGKLIVSGKTLVNEAAGATVTLANGTKRAKVGSTFASFSLLRRFRDVTLFQTVNGAVVNTMSLQISPALVTGAFGLLCREAGAFGGSAPSGTTYAEPTSAAVPAVGVNGALLLEGSSAPISELSFTVENGVTPRPVVGSEFTTQPAFGRFNVTGQVVAYFEDATLVNYFLAGTEVELCATVEFSDGQFMRFTLPRIVFTGGQPDVSGQGPVTLTMPFQASYDITEQSSLTIEKSYA